MERIIDKGIQWGVWNEATDMEKKKKEICITEVIAPNAGINVLDHVLHCHRKELSKIGLTKTDFIK